MRWRAPAAVAQPRNLLEKYSGAQSWITQPCCPVVQHRQHLPSVAAFSLQSPCLHTIVPRAWCLVLSRYRVPRAEGDPHQVPALRLPPPGQGETTHTAAQPRRQRCFCSLQHHGARWLAKKGERRVPMTDSNLSYMLQRKLEERLAHAVQQRDAFETSLRARGEELASLRAAAKERDSTFRIANPEVRPGRKAESNGVFARTSAHVARTAPMPPQSRSRAVDQHVFLAVMQQRTWDLTCRWWRRRCWSRRP